MFKVAIIGTGVISEFHRQGWNNIPDAEIICIVDSNPAQAKKRAEEWKIKSWFTDYKEILKNPEITICDICLPHNLHTSVIIDCLNAGKHVICEKPIALKIEDAYSIIEKENKSGKKLMIAENWYYIPVIAKAKLLYDAGEIGEGYSFQSNLDFPGNRFEIPESEIQNEKGWRGNYDLSGGGVLIDAGIHIFSVGRYFMGEVEYVTGFYGKQFDTNNRGIEDTFNAMALFENESVGQFRCAQPSSFKNGRFDFVIQGTKGVLLIDILKEKVVLKKGDKTNEFVVNAKGGMTEEIEHFVDCILNDKKPLSNSYDQLNSLAFVLAAYKSASQNGMPVKPFNIYKDNKLKSMEK